MHDSDEWRGALREIAALATGQARIEENLKNLKETQSTQHSSNVADIRELKVAVFGNGTRENPGIKTQVDRIETYSQAIAQTLKVIAWILGIGFTAIGLYFSYLQTNHRIGETHLPNISEEHSPDNAKVPPLYK